MQRAGRIGRQSVRERLGELAQRAVDDDAAVGGARRQVDGVELAQLENVLGVDGVGIAQPVLDLGHRQRGRPRRARRLRRRLVGALDLGGTIERARPGEIVIAAVARTLPALFAGHRGEPLHEARGHGRRAGQLGRIGEDHLVGAERLREIVGGERDAPLRQIEAERVAHGPAEPGIGARLRRPDALDQPAEHDAVDALQPRFERAVDAHAHARQLRPPHHAIRRSPSGTARHSRSAPRQNRRPSCRAISSKALSSAAPSVPSKATGTPVSSVLSAATTSRWQRRDARRSDMQRRLSSGASASVNRSTRSAAASSSPSVEVGARIGRMQIGRLLAPQLGELGAEGRERVCKSGGARLRARAAQHAPSPAPRSRAHARLRAPPSRESGCLSNASRRDRRAARRAPLPPQAAQTARPACRRARRRRNRRPRPSSARARRRTRRASARSGVTRAAVLPGVSTASRSATAMASASSSALAASMTDNVASAPSICVGKSAPRAAASGRWRRPAAAPRRRSARAHARRACRARRPPRARCRCGAAAPAWRIADARPRARRARGRRPRAAADQLPRFGIEIGVEAGQHHGAVREAWRWSRSARRSPASSRSSRRRSPVRRGGRRAAPLRP